MSPSATIAPGAHILVRNEAWRVVRIDPTSTGGKAIRVVGLSELVRDKEAIFLDELETEVQVLDPTETKLVRDESPHYQATLLALESQLRRMPPTDERLHLGHRAAMDALPFQLEPAAKALRQNRQRILIADAVGLGKTLEAGILLSELIARGRGKRILVVTLKSLLTQFQKEMWSRFCIPLVRLDSIGLQRIRHLIPTNHNPFYHFDKTIISIDTLKQNNEYRHYLENAFWDVILIDEAHNVALRGTNASLRARLAALLSSRSDSLVMLSATPHDGRPQSFASLMNMLDPTAIVDENEYAPEDIRGLYIRRFRKDVADQLGKRIPERSVVKRRATASSEEETAFERFVALSFKTIDRHSSGHHLFRTVLEKALLSSPRACIQTIGSRVQRLEKEALGKHADDIAALNDLRSAVEAIGPDQFSKYQRLLAVLRDEFHWTGGATNDRLVIFTERLETMAFLYERLLADFSLNENQVRRLDGSTLGDVEQQQLIEEFGKERSPLRLLIATDVAAEGINLHYLCHRMIHFDIPWSLLVFQQRNGRIDRYGQKHQPIIVYLLTDAATERIRGDRRILEILIDKEDQAQKNIGDPAALMGVHDVDKEEAITAHAMESGDADAFAAKLAAFNPFDIAINETAVTTDPAEVIEQILSLFEDDFDYLKAALGFLGPSRGLSYKADLSRRRIDLELTDDLRRRFRQLPRELDFSDNHLLLSGRGADVQANIEAAWREENTWPALHYLWPLHPVLEWAGDLLAASFGRHSAPIMCLDQGLAQGEVAFVISGLLPNRKSQALVHRWFAVVFREHELDRVEDFAEFANRARLGNQKIPNRGEAVDLDGLHSTLGDAVAEVRARMNALRDEYEIEMRPRLAAELKRLAELRDRKREARLRLFEGKSGQRVEEQRAAQEREIAKVFSDYKQWIEDSRMTEEHPFLQVLAAFVSTASATSTSA